MEHELKYSNATPGLPPHHLPLQEHQQAEHYHQQPYQLEPHQHQYQQQQQQHQHQPYQVYSQVQPGQPEPHQQQQYLQQPHYQHPYHQQQLSHPQQQSLQQQPYNQPPQLQQQLPQVLPQQQQQHAQQQQHQQHQQEPYQPPHQKQHQRQRSCPANEIDAFLVASANSTPKKVAAENQPTQNAYDDYPYGYLLPLSAASAFICCLCTGLVAVYYASKVNSDWANGRFSAAQRNATKAKAWSVATIVGGILMIAIAIILVTTEIITIYN